MKILYLIPARGGSKGLPNKNIRFLHGKPLIAYSIIAANSSDFKGNVVVSTDSNEIAEAGLKYKATVPFLRPENLASDTAATIDVIIHALEWYKEKQVFFDTVVLLQPTSPLRTSKDIDDALLLFKSKKAEAVASVCEAEHHPLWTNVLPEDGNMENFLRDEVKGKNRQQLPKYFRLNGAVFISTTDALYKHKSFIHQHTFAFKMPVERSIDIDTEMDFKLAEQYLV